jgi:RNA polymerase sigma-70 factor (ECF subfamily)
MSQMSTATVPEPIQFAAAYDFEQIYREFAPLVYRTAWGVLGSREDAQDVLQRIFLRLLRRESPPDLQKNPKAYLRRAAVNESLNTLKMRRRGPVDFDDLERLAGIPASSPDGQFDDDMHERLYAAIGQLSPEAAEILILRYMYNTSTADIGRMLGVSRTVIGVRLFRSRARLKILLKGTSGEKS